MAIRPRQPKLTRLHGGFSFWDVVHFLYMAAKKPAKKTTPRKPAKPKFVNPVGRPPKWSKPEQMQKLIDAYFASCWKLQTFRTPNDEARKREANKPALTRAYAEADYIQAVRLDEEGTPIFNRIRPYTITGLALALGTTRETLRDYEKNIKFTDTVRRAKMIIHNFTEEGFIDGDITPSAAIFSLKNNYGWTEEQTVNHGVADSLADLLTQADEKPGSGKTTK